MIDWTFFARPSLLIGWVALCALTGSAPGWSAEPSGPPLRIGVSLGLTGTYTALGDMHNKAYRLWEHDVNARGGILGRRVEMTIRDDKSDPAVSRQIYEQFILRDKVDFVFGPYSSTLTAAVAPLAEQHGYPMLAPGAASDDIWKHGYRNIFGVIPPAGRYPVGFLAVLAEAKITKLAVVYADDPFSVNLAEGAKRWSAEYGVQLTVYQKIVKGTANLDKEAAAAKQSGAEALLMAGHFDESVNMRRSLKRIQWTPRAYYASIGPGLDSYKDALNGDAEGTFSTSVWEAREDLKLLGSAEFLRDFVRNYGDKPSYQAAMAYAAGQVLDRAIQKAGRIDRAAVRDALSQLDTDVLVGRYVVDRTGVQTKRFPLLIQWQQGRREIVWPPELQNAAPKLRK